MSFKYSYLIYFYRCSFATTIERLWHRYPPCLLPNDIRTASFKAVIRWYVVTWYFIMRLRAPIKFPIYFLYRIFFFLCGISGNYQSNTTVNNKNNSRLENNCYNVGTFITDLDNNEKETERQLDHLET